MFHDEPAMNDSDLLSNRPHSNTNTRDELPVLPNRTESPPPSIPTSSPHTSTPGPSLPMQQSQQAAAVPLMSLQLPNLAQEALERLANKRQPVEDDSDFVTVKKKKVEESSGCGEEELQTCSICFEPWTNSGSHRVASLRCGHLYGLTCIEKWLRSAGGGKCPQCNCKAKRSDVRVIFAKTVSMQDTSERDRALKELEEEKLLRIQDKREASQLLLELNLVRCERDKLKEEVERLKVQLASFPSCSAVSAPLLTGPGLVGEGSAPAGGVGVGRYTPLKTICVSRNGSARVMAYDTLQGMLVVSKSSDNRMLPGNGVTKLSTIDLRHTEYVGIHSATGTIRDMSFRPYHMEGTLLTAATDKTAKLTSLHSNTVLQSYELVSPVWSCCWDLDDNNYFYCGLQNGSIVIYDIRCPAAHLSCLSRQEGGKCPLTSLAAVPRDISSSLNCGGLLMGSLGGCVFWEKSTNFSSVTDFKARELHTLPEGPCISVSFEPSTRHCLSSFRPTRRSPQGKHTLYQLHNVPTDKPLSCQPVQQYPGGSSHRLISRSQLFLRPETEEQLLAVYGDEGTKKVHIWDVSSTLELQELCLAQEPALDMVPFGGGCGSKGAESHLAVLSQSQVHIYSWK